VRERIRYLYRSLLTERVYVYWTNAFVLWAARTAGCFPHAREMEHAGVEGFLTMLDTENKGALAPSGQPAGHTADALTKLAVGAICPL
jgi:hypothetical protein